MIRGMYISTGKMVMSHHSPSHWVVYKNDNRKFDFQILNVFGEALLSLVHFIKVCSLNKYDIIKRTPQSWIQNKDETKLNIREISFASVSEGGHSEPQTCCAHILFSPSILIILLFITGYEVMESRFHISMNFKFPKVDLLCQKRCYMQKHKIF